MPPRPQRSAGFYVATIGGSVLAIGLVMWGLIWAAMRTVNGSTGTPAFAGSSVAVIDLSGVLVDADKFDTQLRKFGDDSSVKAIILHINSPGGGAAASQEMYHEVLRVRQETHKPVVAAVESVGASGAYYIASACDRIYANDASVVGSIGVIMEWTNYGDLMRWAKLKSVVIHAGELKDAGDPSRDLTPKETAYFQSLVDNMYTQFVHDVATGRHTTDDRIRPLATGQVWTGQQALSLGLIDKQGGYRTALMETARSVGISGEPNVVRPARDKKRAGGAAEFGHGRPVSESDKALGPFSGLLFHVEVSWTSQRLSPPPFRMESTIRTRVPRESVPPRSHERIPLADDQSGPGR